MRIAAEQVDVNVRATPLSRSRVRRIGWRACELYLGALYRLLPIVSEAISHISAPYSWVRNTIEALVRASW